MDFIEENMGDQELTLKGVSFTKQILSLVLICNTQTWSPKKKDKEIQQVYKKFQPVDCLYMLNREWTLYKRIWVTKSWPTLESVCHSTFSSLVLIYDAKT